MCFHDSPDDSVVHGVVAAADAVAEVDVALEFGQAGGGEGILLGQAIQGLADNFELPLDGAAEEAVAGVVVEGAAAGVQQDALAGFLDVKQ